MGSKEQAWTAGGPPTNRGGPTPRTLAWPVARFLDGGWRLRVAWAYNGALLGGGLVWLAIMLRALDTDDAGNSGAFWRTFVLGLVFSLGAQDVIKVRGRVCLLGTCVPESSRHSHRCF